MYLTPSLLLPVCLVSFSLKACLACSVGRFYNQEELIIFAKIIISYYSTLLRCAEHLTLSLINKLILLVEPLSKGHFGTSPCKEAVFFSEVEMYCMYNFWGYWKCPLYRGCPFLGGSFIRSSKYCKTRTSIS